MQRVQSARHTRGDLSEELAIWAVFHSIPGKLLRPVKAEWLPPTVPIWLRKSPAIVTMERLDFRRLSASIRAITLWRHLTTSDTTFVCLTSKPQSVSRKCKNLIAY